MRDLDPLRHRAVLGIGAAERFPGDRVTAHTDKKLELDFGDLIALRDPRAAEPGDPGAEPAARRGALSVVIPGQRGRERPVAVAGRDGAQQVLVPVTSAHHSHGHCHRYDLLDAEVSSSSMSARDPRRIRR